MDLAGDFAGSFLVGLFLPLRLLKGWGAAFLPAFSPETIARVVRRGWKSFVFYEGLTALTGAFLVEVFTFLCTGIFFAGVIEAGVCSVFYRFYVL